MLKLTPLLFLLFISCAQRMKVPINKMISPEVIGYGMDLEYRYTSFSEGLLDFSDNSVDNPLQLQTARDQEVFLGFGIAQNTDIFVKVPKESSSMLGLKIQLLGASSKNRNIANQLAITYARGAARDTFTGDSLRINLKSDVSEFSVIHGYRFSPFAMIYESISIGNYEFSGFIESSPAVFSDSQIEYKAANVLGAHIGLELGGINLKSRIELGYQRIKWSNTDTKSLYALSYSLGVTF